MIMEQRIYLMLTVSISFFSLLTYDLLTPVSRASNSVFETSTPAKFNKIRTSYRHKGMTIDEVQEIKAAISLPGASATHDPARSTSRSTSSSSVGAWALAVSRRSLLPRHSALKPSSSTASGLLCVFC